MKQALLIIDIQNDYFPGGSNQLHGAEEAAWNASLLLNDFRFKGLPVIHIQHIATRPTATFFLPGTKGAEIHASVKPIDGEQLIVKHTPNSFHGTDLLEKLRAKEVGQLVICGMMTHMCVDSTTRAAKDFGFDCVLIGDACATKALQFDRHTVPATEVQASLLAALSYYYSTVKTTAQFLKNE